MKASQFGIAVTLALALLGIVARAPVAYADDYTIAGANCVPDSSAFGGNQYYSGSMYLTPNFGVTAEVIFYCGIPSDITSPTAIGMMYSSTANTSNTYAKAELVRMAKSNGNIDVIATADSQNGVNNGWPYIVTAWYLTSYNIANYAYYVRLRVKAESSQSVVFYGLAVF